MSCRCRCRRLSASNRLWRLGFGLLFIASWLSADKYPMMEAVAGMIGGGVVGWFLLGPATSGRR